LVFFCQINFRMEQRDEISNRFHYPKYSSPVASSFPPSQSNSPISSPILQSPKMPRNRSRFDYAMWVLSRPKRIVEYISYKKDDWMEDFQIMAADDNFHKIISFAAAVSLNVLLSISVLFSYQASLGLLLMAISLINMIFFLFSKKKYRLPRYPVSSQNEFINRGNPTVFIEVLMWDPSPIVISLFGYFSPLQVFAAFQISVETDFLIQIIMTALIPLFLKIVITNYQERELIQKRIFEEAYGVNERYAQSFLSKIKKDVSTQTGDGGSKVPSPYADYLYAPIKQETEVTPFKSQYPTINVYTPVVPNRSISSETYLTTPKQNSTPKQQVTPVTPHTPQQTTPLIKKKRNPFQSSS